MKFRKQVIRTTVQSLSELFNEWWIFLTFVVNIKFSSFSTNITSGLIIIVILYLLFIST